MDQSRERIFEDRRDAGQQLATELLKRLPRLRQDNPIVLGLPRGGVVVASEVAKALGAPLDIIVARKLGAPMQPELGIGAVAPGGIRVIDERIATHAGVRASELDSIIAQETEEMNRRQLLYRGAREELDLRERTVILVDDGLATGVTARAACRSIRRQSPRQLILAAPVCAAQSLIEMSGEADRLVCVLTPVHFSAVGVWYDNFDQTTDQEVVALLHDGRLSA
jgi:putative phosphoribosyl transferase